MAEALSHASLHYTILKAIIDKGYAPTVSELSKFFNASEEEIKAALNALQDYHGVVLHPKNSEVWVIHPFSLAPTNFLLIKEDREWWGNCAWCSLGAAALLGGDVLIRTTLGANGQQVTLQVKGGELLDMDYYIHFPVPMENAWDNVIYTCSTMLLFDNETSIDAWSTRHRIPKGDIRPISQIWAFSKAWYGKHLDPGWQKWTAEEAKALFEQYGLNSSIWEIPVSTGRF